MKQSELDFLWLIQFFNKRLPLFHGLFSKFVVDNHPQTVVAYMEPISKSPTNNDVVRKTMLRSQEVVHEMKQDYTVVTYDLAIAIKPYCIQALQAPRFDNVIILLGNFHLEMVFFGTIGTYFCDSGIEYLLTEAVY